MEQEITQNPTLETQPKKRGRPAGSVKTKSTDEHWADKLIRLYEEGASDVEVCRALRLSYNEFNKKYKSDQLFSELVDYGRLAAKSWWMTLGREAAKGGNKANYNFWYAVMKNRYGWADKVEQSISDGDKPLDQMSQDDITAELAKKASVLSKILKPSNILLSQLALDEPTGT